LLLLAIVGSVSPSYGADPFANIDTYAADALKDWNTPAMAISVVRDGRVVFARGYGVRKLGEDDAVDADTVFPIASITKSFNATALAMLVEDGKLSWLDSVAKHLPEFQLADPCMTREVRIADLLSHRTGLDDPELLSYSGVTRNELMRRLRYLPQIVPFRSEFRYNNLGTIVAGEILERVAGQSWAEFVRVRIIRALDMTSTVPDVLELRGVNNVATCYVAAGGTPQEDKSWNLPLTAGWSQYRETIRPAGAICSTANDLAKFVMFQLAAGEFRGRRLLKATTVNEMQTLHSVAPLKEVPEPALTSARIVFGAGYGWQIRDYRGRKLVMHDGSTGTVIGLLPREGIGVVVLTNLGCGLQFMVMHDVIDRLLGINRTWSNRDFVSRVIDDEKKSSDTEQARLDSERRKDVKPRFPVNAYAGTYECPLYGRLVIRETDGMLSMQLGPNCQSDLVHWSADRFRATFLLRFPEDWFLSFASADNRVVKVTIANTFPSKEVAIFTRTIE
jgi:CubicO group peptidase (beta-lactamase class C family)